MRVELEEMDGDYDNYWDTKLFLDDEEFINSCWLMDEPLSYSYDDSSSPDRANSPTSSSSTATAAKNIVMERNRRRKFNERLYSLRSIVPNITKLDKASIIKDAIDYIHQLQTEEKKLVAEVGSCNGDLEEMIIMEPSTAATCQRSELYTSHDQNNIIITSSTDLNKHINSEEMVGMKSSFTSSCLMKNMRGISQMPFEALSPVAESIEAMDLNVCEVGEKCLVVSITCNKKKDTMAKVCEIFESLNLRIITATFTTLSTCILHTLFVETDEANNGEFLKKKIEVAIAEFNNLRNSMSFASF